LRAEFFQGLSHSLSSLMFNCALHVAIQKGTQKPSITCSYVALVLRRLISNYCNIVKPKFIVKHIVSILMLILWMLYICTRAM